jgi:6-phosphogluconolactonase
MVLFYEYEQLIERIAGAFIQVVQEALSKQAFCSLALSGGSTPRALYKYLAQPSYRKAVNWSQVHFFWGDERYVPHDHPAGNYKMAYEAWLKYLAIPSSNIHPMPTDFSKPDDAAHAYEEEIRRYVTIAERTAFPSFGLILLGIGEDGHTASLFPGGTAIEETKRWCVPASAPVEPKQRLTLTLPVLNSAHNVWFLVTGVSKAPVLKRVLDSLPHEPLLPAARVKPAEGELVWWVDSAIDLMD